MLLAIARIACAGVVLAAIFCGGAEAGDGSVAASYELGYKSLGLSPDGAYLAYYRIPRAGSSKLEQKQIFPTLFVHDRVSNKTVAVEETRFGTIPGPQPTWSPDSRHLAYYSVAENEQLQLRVWSREAGRVIARSAATPCASNLCKDLAPVWTGDGKSILFISPSKPHRLSDHSIPRDHLDLELHGAVPAPKGMTVLSSPAVEGPNAKQPSTERGYDSCPANFVIALNPATNAEKKLAAGLPVVDIQLAKDGTLGMLTVCDDYAQNLFSIYRLDLTPGSHGSAPVRIATDLKMLYGQTTTLAPSGRSVAYAEWGESSGGNLFVIDIKTGERRNLTAQLDFELPPRILQSGDAIEWTTNGRFGSETLAPIWSPDESELLAFRAVPRDDNSYPVRFDLWRVPVATGVAVRVPVPQDLSIVDVGVCSGRRKPCLADDTTKVLVKLRSATDGTQSYATLDATTGRLRKLFEFGKTPVGGTNRELDANVFAARSLIAANGTAVAAVETFQEPQQLVVMNIGDKYSAQRTKLLNSSVPPVGSIKRITWRDAGGGTLSGLLRLPSSAKSGSPLPVVTWVYFSFDGGHRDGFMRFDGGDVMWRALLESRRYAVFVPEIPLPKGKGHGCDEISANVANGLDALVATGLVDGKRAGLMGYSYGGYIVNCVITRTPRFRAAVAGSGLSDWTTLCLGLPPGCSRKNVMNIDALPWEAPERYVSESPIYHLDKVATPLLLFFGKAEGPVPRNQFIEMYAGLASLEKPVQLVAYDGTNHSTTPAHPDFWPRALNWFDTYLNGNGPPQYQAPIEKLSSP